MDKNSKILLSSLFLCLALSAGAAYYRYIVVGAFAVETDEEAFMSALEETE